MTAPNPIPFAKRVKYAFETALVYLFFGLCRILPVDAASGMGGAIMRCIGPLTGISRRAMRNLDLAFPEKNVEEKKKILKGMWDNLGRTAAEYGHLTRLGSRVEVVGQENFGPFLEGKQPVILFGAHLANWEITHLLAKRHGVDIHVVYRKPNNPYVDGLLRAARSTGVAGYIAKGSSGAREVFSVLRKGGKVGMLIDQKLSEGLPVPFFGRPALTADAPARFALKLGCTLLPTRVERLGGAHFRVTVFPPLKVNTTGDDDDTLRILTEMNACVESWIRERPEQWLWIHRRWPESK